MSKIINEQKVNWAWDYRYFYHYNDGTVYELSQRFKKGIWIYWNEPPQKEGLIGKILCKNKVDRYKTTLTGKLTYKTK